jgi:hypothetical protein
MYTGRPAGEDNSARLPGHDVLILGIKRYHFAEYAEFPDPTGNKLIVLAAEIQDQDNFVFVQIIHSYLLYTFGSRIQTDGRFR